MGDAEVRLFATVLFWLSLGGAFATAGTDESDWATTLSQVTPAVVSIRMDRSRPFDTQGAGNSYATGFVVDAERGIILTNRHVVSPGPSRAEAVFLNNEEVPLQLLYRDPVHDFGFYHFDPAALRFMAVKALELDPTGAKVGAEVRVVGNDAGEKISILAGTIARLDRAAPPYGKGNYNDFNTFYIQAASGTSGGSSGSPVVGANGKVLALNAGGASRSASSYYLPLDRVVQALKELQQGKPVARGTIQVTFEQRTFDELARLGLSGDLESNARARFPTGNGLLVVDTVVPSGPADGKLRPGDILLEIQRRQLDAFIPLEEILDSSVGKPVTLRVVREGKATDVTIDVQDLHAITPDGWIEAGGAVLHPLSYQKARSFNIPVRGIVLARRGYLFDNSNVPEGAIIREINGKPAENLPAVWSVLENLGDQETLVVRWSSYEDPGRSQLEVVSMDRRWFPLRKCAWDATVRDWPCSEATTAPPAVPPKPGRADLHHTDGRIAKKVAPSLVSVEFTVPWSVDGVHGFNFRGTGLVVDNQVGLVVVDRDTVPVSLGDVSLTFGGTLEIPGEVVWLHPAQNLAFVRYDPGLILDTPVVSARLYPRKLARGSNVTLVGLNRDQQVVWKETEVEREQPVEVPKPAWPAFRPRHVDGILIDDAVATTGGVLADRRGRVNALWLSYVDLSKRERSSWMMGLSVKVLEEALAWYGQAPAAPWPILGAELTEIEMSKARKLGLPEPTALALEALSPERKKLLVVSRLTKGSSAAEVLRPGDLLVSVGGVLVTRASEVDDQLRSGEAVRLKVFREGSMRDLDVVPVLRSVLGTQRVISWAGATLQDVPALVADQAPVEAAGVYVAQAATGSPASRYELRPKMRIMAVNGVEVSDLDGFLRAVRSLEGPVRLRVLDLENREQMVTIRPNIKDWPTEELVRGELGWARTVLTQP